MTTQSRRDFLKKSIAGAGGIYLASTGITSAVTENRHITPKKIPFDPCRKTITIAAADLQFEREPLLHPFGFKGGYLSELWQSVAKVQSDSGLYGIGLGIQSVLWSDSNIFSSYPESGGNALMYALTARALQIIKGMKFQTPVGLLDEIVPELFEYGKRITANANLRLTFVLNALVPVDNALWVLYARENAITDFDELIPAPYKAAFTEKHDKLAAIPLISYNVSSADIRKEADNGYFFMKIKIGQAGTQQEMLDKDMARLTQIHSVLKDLRTPHTESGKLPYYFDANGRYEKKETLLRFLDHAAKLKALDQIALIEEPFPEEKEIQVGDIPVRLAADESAHSEKDALHRIQLGYKAMALKPIAKTLSMTMKVAAVSLQKNIPCFCADLTVNPVMVEWNKNVAARLHSFPGLKNIGLVESNGHQNYTNWEQMKTYNPAHQQSWAEVKKGFYHTSEAFFEKGGGIFDPLPHYENLFTKK